MYNKVKGKAWGKPGRKAPQADNSSDLGKVVGWERVERIF